MSGEPLADKLAQTIIESSDQSRKPVLTQQSLDLSCLSKPFSTGKMNKEIDEAGSSSSEYRQKHTVKKLDRTFVIAKKGNPRKRICCRICKVEMYKKNMNAHLRDFHGITEQQN